MKGRTQNFVKRVLKIESKGRFVTVEGVKVDVRSREDRVVGRMTYDTEVIA